MATALSALRAKLNGEIGVDTDAESLPWSQTVRNNAISDGYAELWRVGVWKPLTQTITVLDNTWRYALTSMRVVSRAEVIDSASYIIDQSQYTVEDDGSGGFSLIVPTPLNAGYSLTVTGWGPFASTFANDASVDDLPAEYNRIPLLKAKAILYRQQLGRFMRYAERQSNPPEMNVTVSDMLAVIAATEREFEVEAKRYRDRMPRFMQTTRVLQT